MRRAILPALLCALALLTACGKEEPLNWTPTPVTPQPTATAPAEADTPWTALTVDDLPTALATAADLFSSEEPQIYLLGCKLGEELYLYGLNEGWGGGILLRRGEELTHFDQAFSPVGTPALPELYLADWDGDGDGELAVRYLMAADGDRIAYDLHIYDWADGAWTDCGVTHDAAAGRFTLSYGSTSAVYQVPAQYRADPGGLTLDTCFFREQNGTFTVVLGARLDATGTLFANILATIDFQGGDFTLRDIRVEPTTVV